MEDTQIRGIYASLKGHPATPNLDLEFRGNNCQGRSLGEGRELLEDMG